MKQYIKASKEQYRGVFWIVDGDILAYPFIEDNLYYIDTVDMRTYNHKRLWDYIKPKGSKYPYNYYPRGRVDFKSDGTPVIYMNPNIDDSYIPDIKREFGLRKEPIVRYDFSEHYKCHLDDGFKY